MSEESTVFAVPVLLGVIAFLCWRISRLHYQLAESTAFAVRLLSADLQEVIAMAEDLQERAPAKGPRPSPTPQSTPGAGPYSIPATTAPPGQHWRFPGGPIDLAEEDGMETSGQPPWIERAIFAVLVVIAVVGVVAIVYA